jgi:hypothetical protein
MTEKTDLEVQKEMHDLKEITRQRDGKVAYLKGRDNVAIFDRRGNHKVTVSCGVTTVTEQFRN